MTDMPSLTENVAGLVWETYEALQQTGKPAIRSNGIAEWTILAGIVAQRKDSSLHCLSVATGVKCLPHDKVVQAKGLALHDSHAEILAIRGFNRFLLDEIIRIQTQGEYVSPWLSRCSEDEMNNLLLFTFNVCKIYLFISGTPCGDASLDLLAEDPANATPWTLKEEVEEAKVFRGHEYLWERGQTKGTGRADSPQTFSKSCTDKLTLISCTSLLNSLLASIVDPANCYLDYLVVPDAAYHREGFDRAFEGRIESIRHATWPGNFHVQPIQTLTSQLSLPSVLIPEKSASLKASNATAPASIIHVHGRQTEIMLNGVRMGSKFPPNLRGSSSLCRARMGKDFLEIVRREKGLSRCMQLPENSSYAQLKRLGGRRHVVKRTVQETLGGWVTNEGDEDFVVESLLPTRT